MNTKELVTKAIRAGIKYSEDTYWDEPKELDRMASTLSLGLITLTEERLKKIIEGAFLFGVSWGDNEGCSGCSIEAIDYASRIIEALKKEAV